MSTETEPFSVVVRGRYTPGGPDYTDGEALVIWKSTRSEKRLAELEVMRAIFLEWYERTKVGLGS
jgi:hypothetical protein